MWITLFSFALGAAFWRTANLAPALDCRDLGASWDVG
jgi:hypothetical protein